MAPNETSKLRWRVKRPEIGGMEPGKGAARVLKPFDLHALSIFLSIKSALAADQKISTGGLLIRRPK